MPKRLIDADAAWQSEKLAHCRPESVPEYTWLYGIADSNGIFEITNIRAIHSVAYGPIRRHISPEDLGRFFADFERNGLMFTWKEGTKRFAFWTGSETGARLPELNRRLRYKNCKNKKKLYDGPTDDRVVVDQELAEYLARFEVHEEDEYELFREVAEPKIAVESAPGESVEYPADFERFWTAYPYKHRKSFAFKAWNKTVTEENVEAVIEAVARWNKTDRWKQDNGFIPDPDSWLLGKDWQTENPRNGNGVSGGKFPGGSTYEDGVERLRKNAETLRRERL